MTASRIIAGVALIVAVGLGLHLALAQQPGFNRFDLSGTISASPDAR